MSNLRPLVLRMTVLLRIGTKFGIYFKNSDSNWNQEDPNQILTICPCELKVLFQSPRKKFSEKNSPLFFRKEKKGSKCRYVKSAHFSNSEKIEEGKRKSSKGAKAENLFFFQNLVSLQRIFDGLNPFFKKLMK